MQMPWISNPMKEANLNNIRGFVLERIAPIIVILQLLVGIGCIKDHTSDEEMIRKFQAHKSKFEKLVQMLRDDEGLYRVTQNFTRPRDEKLNEIGITEERIKEYRKLLEEIECGDLGIEGSYNKDAIYIHESVRGLSISGSTKSFVHLRKKPEQMRIVDNLDNYEPKDEERVYKTIKENWFLTLDVEF